MLLARILLLALFVSLSGFERVLWGRGGSLFSRVRFLLGERVVERLFWISVKAGLRELI